MKQNQIIALVQGKKARAAKLLTSIHHSWKDGKIEGISRTYSPLADDGEKFPSESRVVQVRVESEIKKLQVELNDVINIVFTQECGNTHAEADIIVNETSLLHKVPVTALLFLEKQLVDLKTFAQKLPTLPTDKVWSKDEAKNCWVTEQEQTVKTQKVIEPIVKYDATPEHPAQTDLITKDKTIGHWSTIHLSGALPETERDAIVARIETLQDAVKIAREEANSQEVDMKTQVGEAVLGYIFTSE
jgi:hypothetical protein